MERAYFAYSILIQCAPVRSKRNKEVGGSRLCRRAMICDGEGGSGEGWGGRKGGGEWRGRLTQDDQIHFYRGQKVLIARRKILNKIFPIEKINYAIKIVP